MDYPLLITLADNSVMYQITSKRSFVEWKRIGLDKSPSPNSYMRTSIDEADYATGLYIQDLLDNLSRGLYKEISKAKLQEILDSAHIIN